jgi:hypothetical protein
MKTIGVLTYRLKGSNDITTEHYDFSDNAERVDYEASVEALRAIRDDAGNYIQESSVDYMVTSFQTVE